MQHLVFIIGFWERIWLWADQADTWLFLQINSHWTHPWLDNILPWWRDANSWIPLYLFMILFLFLNFKNKAWWWLLFAVINVILTDQISSHLIKNFIQRPRPCADDYLQFHIRLLLDHCSGGYSFTSSHATNHFGFAVFVFITLKDVLKKWKWLFIVWAATISYGQVYVGVHYPLDVFCGALLGSFIGFMMSRIYTNQFGTLQLSS
jgi:undecaprenyl-diphosphatase